MNIKRVSYILGSVLLIALWMLADTAPSFAYGQHGSETHGKKLYAAADDEGDAGSSESDEDSNSRDSVDTEAQRADWHANRWEESDNSDGSDVNASEKDSGDSENADDGSDNSDVSDWSDNSDEEDRDVTNGSRQSDEKDGGSDSGWKSNNSDEEDKESDQYDNEDAESGITVTTGTQTAAANVSQVASDSVKLNFTVGNSGTAYFVAVPKGATAPNVQQLLDGVDGSDGDTPSDNMAVEAGSDEFDITELKPATAYTVYFLFVAEDRETSAILSNDFRTLASGSGSTGTGSTGTGTSATGSTNTGSTSTGSTSGTGSTGTGTTGTGTSGSGALAPTLSSVYASSISASGANVNFVMSKPGTAYIVLLPSGSATPTATQVQLGKNASGAAAPIRNFGYSMSGSNQRGVIGLTPSTQYSLFITATDMLGNLQQNVTKVTFVTLQANASGSGSTATGSTSTGSTNTGSTSTGSTSGTGSTGTGTTGTGASTGTGSTGTGTTTGTGGTTGTGSTGSWMTTGTGTTGTGSTGSGDTTPPTITGFTVSGITASGASASFSANEAGTGYYIITLSGAAAPTAEQVFQGKDASGATAAIKGSASFVNGTNAMSITGLTPNTAYVIYFLAKDAAGNAQVTGSSLGFKTNTSTVGP